MKITNIRVFKANLETTRPYTIAYKTVDSVESCFVVLETDNGLQGVGAANPSKYVVGDDVDATLKILNESALEFLMGRDACELGHLNEEVFINFGKHAGALAALDIALHDLHARYVGVPLVRLLGQHVESLPTSVTIGIKNVADTLEEAEEYIGNGFKILKVKLGHSVQEDLERLRKLRERFGNQIGIRVDANQGYSVGDLLRFYQHSESMKLELIEQPLKAEDLEAYRLLPDAIRRCIAMDESLVSAQDAWDLAQPDPIAGIYNIKLMKCGGIHQARRIAEIARLAGIDLMWGCNDESVVSISAALHVAFSSPQTKYIDLDGSLDLAKDLASGGFVLEEGYMRPTDAPGLGVIMEDVLG